MRFKSLIRSRTTACTNKYSCNIFILKKKRTALKIATVLTLSIILSRLCLPFAGAAEILQQTSAAERIEAAQFKKPDPHPGAKIGLALGGGGARGAAHVGVLKVLDEAGIKYDLVVGTSIGAIVGGFYCLGSSPAAMEGPVLKADPMRKFMSVPLFVRIIAAPVLFIPRLLGANPYDGLYGGKTFHDYLLGSMLTKDQKIEDLKIPFAAVTFNLIDGKPYLVRKGNLVTAMQASSAVPSLRKPVEVDGQLLVDGGVICNLPVKQCRELGADFVIAVNIDEPFKKLPLHHFRQPGSVAERMLNWGLWDIDEPQSALADITIHPDTEGISLISTKKSDARKALLAGEKAAREALPLLLDKLRRLEALQTNTAQ